VSFNGWGDAAAALDIVRNSIALEQQTYTRSTELGKTETDDQAAA
jgi:hypothetical protein